MTMFCSKMILTRCPYSTVPTHITYGSLKEMVEWAWGSIFHQLVKGRLQGTNLPRQVLKVNVLGVACCNPFRENRGLKPMLNTDSSSTNSRVCTTVVWIVRMRSRIRGADCIDFTSNLDKLL